MFPAEGSPPDPGRSLQRNNGSRDATSEVELLRMYNQTSAEASDDHDRKKSAGREGVTEKGSASGRTERGGRRMGSTGGRHDNKGELEERQVATTHTTAHSAEIDRAKWARPGNGICGCCH